MAEKKIGQKGELTMDVGEINMLFKDKGEKSEEEEDLTNEKKMHSGVDKLIEEKPNVEH